MGDWPLIEGQRAKTCGAVPASSTGTSLPGTTVHVKSGWVTLGYTEFTVKSMLVNMAVNATASSRLVDIGVGVAGSERIIAKNLWGVSVTGAANRQAPYFLPHLNIPSGTRISARCQTTPLNAAGRITVTCLANGFLGAESLGRWATYGAVEATSQGTPVTPGATAHTDSAWTTLGYTEFDTQAIIIAIGTNTVATTARGSATHLIDLARGVAGSEREILSDYLCNGISTDDNVHPMVSPLIPVSIPAGTRLSVRGRGSASVAADNAFGCVVYGFG